MLSNRLSKQWIDPLSRLAILIAGLFTIVALTLSIVGTATTSWYYDQDSLGNTQSYNLFTYCTGNLLESSSICVDMSRETSLGLGTQNAAGLLVVALCLLGSAMIITLLMNCVLLTGILSFIAPTLLFLASLFILAALAEGSRVTKYNSYSAHLVQTGHLLTILCMGLTGFAAGRLHIQSFPL